MTEFNIHVAKANLSDLIRRALRGEEVVIARRNVPLVRLVSAKRPAEKRSLGWAEGRIEIADDFDEIPADLAEYA
jgi:prevent-host-death family protein